jgi:hypothetical protein
VVTTPPRRPRTRRRLVLAGLLGAAVLTGGAGAAYAANTDNRPVETGYAVVAADDCPYGGAEGTGVPVQVEIGGNE